MAIDKKEIAGRLAPGGILRAGINMSNFLLVTGVTAAGEPDGVSPDMARALAAELGLDAQMVTYKGPGQLADAIADDGWDIGNIAAEPERARTIQFSQAYCEIQATYLIGPESASTITTIEDVDQAGIRIAVKDRSAYDLWLTDNLKHADLIRVASIDESFEVFVADKLEVLAGLRPALQSQSEKLPGSVLLNDSFTAIQQSIGCRPGDSEVAAYIEGFVRRSIAEGRVASLIEKHGVAGRLSVAPLKS